MDYTRQQIEQVEEYASLFLKISDIALLIGVDPDVLRDDIADRTSDVSFVYHVTKLQTIARLRRQEIQQAELGSNIAIELVSKYITDQTLDE